MMIAYGIFSTNGDQARVGARVDNKVVDLMALCAAGLLEETDSDCFKSVTLNNFIKAGYVFRQNVKRVVLELLNKEPDDSAIYNLDEVKLYLPLQIGGYTDFYASKQHATNIGKIFRPDAPLMPNWLHIPIAYNGRASSVVVSEHPVKRPQGQILVDGKPQFEYSRKIDLEVELGIVIGKENNIGEPISINNAIEYIFGVCVVNDWSARDIQAWEYQPLGPFTSKSFLTAISAFIVPLEELDAYKTTLKPQDPKPLAYLQEHDNSTYDIKLEVTLKTEKLPQGMVICRTNFKDIYWSMRQWITHHTVTGCNLKVGDLLASGTISGDSPDSFGSLMELTINGKETVKLPNGETRAFLEDGDEIIISAYCGDKENPDIIGDVAGKIVPTNWSENAKTI